MTAPLQTLKALCNRQAVALRRREEEIDSLKRLVAVQQEATQRALCRAERAELALERLQTGAGDVDDDQPDEMTEWRDYDPDC